MADMEKFQVNDCEEVLLSMKLISGQLSEVLSKLDKKVIIGMLTEILTAKRVFVMGAGRSGLVAKAFAMRLMHLGFTVYVVGETITPAVSGKDVVIAISGSGETRSIADLGKIVKDIGSPLITVTSKPSSTLADISDLVMVIPSKAKNDLDAGDFLERNMRGDYKNRPPLGTAFEITALVFLDSMVVQLITLTGASEAELQSRHTNIE